MPTDPNHVKKIFLGASELPDEPARIAYLDRVCVDDAWLRDRVEALLRSHDTAASFLGTPAAAFPTLAHAGTVPVAPSSAGSPPSPDPIDETDGLEFLSPSSRPDSLGRLGHYEVLHLLGKGGFGIVFRAFDETLHRVVAIKVLAPQLAVTSPARKRFLREARSSARVRHENVVQVYAVEEQPLPHLVMEFIPGETLQHRLDRCGPMETIEVLHLGRQIAEGLAAAHAQGLIHRDIKPANILLEASPHQRVKITDFGLARAADDASLTQSGLLAGTPMYMAPEQAQGEKFDHRADLFSLGSVFHTMSSGRPPFRANGALAVLKRVVEDTPRPIPDIIPEVPQWLCNIIARLHAKKPEDRIASAKEVADLLGQGLSAMQGPGNVPAFPEIPPATAVKVTPVKESRRDPPFERGGEELAAPAIRRPRFRTRRWVLAAGVLVLCLVGLGFTEAAGVTNVRGTVIRLFSPEGTLVVEVDDPEVSIQIDGSDLVITGAGAKEIRLKPGSYTVEARKDGKVVSRELITVLKNGRQSVRVSKESVPPDTAKASVDHDRRAAEYVLSIGGILQVNGRDLKNGTELPSEPFRLTYVKLANNQQVTDENLANFKGCENLTHLLLFGTKVGDAGMVHFKNCKKLKLLDLNWTTVTDAGAAHFKGCNDLAFLCLAHTQATDAALANFKDCKDLATVAIGDMPIGDAGLAYLKEWKNLTLIHLDGTQVTNAGLAQFKDCENLTKLMLQNNARVSDAGVAHLKACKNLAELQVQKTSVTAACIDDLKKALPKCKIEWDGGVIEPK